MHCAVAGTEGVMTDLGRTSSQVSGSSSSPYQYAPFLSSSMSSGARCWSAARGGGRYVNAGAANKSEHIDPVKRPKMGERGEVQNPTKS